MTKPNVLNMRDHPRLSDTVVYVGRPTQWGNPFRAGVSYRGVYRTRSKAVEDFRSYAVKRAKDPKWLEPLLDAEALVCWCSPLKCHADVLAELIERRNDS